MIDEVQELVTEVPAVIDLNGAPGALALDLIRPACTMISPLAIGMLATRVTRNRGTIAAETTWTLLIGTRASCS